MSDSSKVSHQALDLTTAEAVAWSADHPDWWIFPARMVQDPDDGSWIKRPLVLWTKRATRDPEEVRRLWDSVGGRAVVCVACEPSKIFVIDEDRDVTDPTWKSILDMVRDAKMTLVLKSCTKGRPHYVFKQPPKGDPVAEGRWDSGDVKASGMIVISSHDPIVDAPVRHAPAGLLTKLSRRPLGSRGRGLASYEALNDWLAATPEFLILGGNAQEKFLDKTIEKMYKAVDDEGAHRRQAALATVYHGALEAAAGCYPADKAFKAIKEAYEGMRSSDDGAKGWTTAREADYDAMWASLVPEFIAGDHDEAVEEIRKDLFDRDLSEDPEDDFSDLSDWFEKLINADVAAEERATSAATTAVPPEGYDKPVLLSTDSVPLSTDHVEDHKKDKFSDPAIDNVVESENGLKTQTSDLSGSEVLETPALTRESEEISEDPETTKPVITVLTSAEAHAKPKIRKAGKWEKVDPIDVLPLEMGPECYWGPHGDFINKARKHTEVSDAGLLAVALACSGVYHAKAAHLNLGGAIHGPNVFVMAIGESAASRKSTAMATMREVYFPRDPGIKPLYRPQIFSGMASGERLLHMWDPEEIKELNPISGLEEVVEYPREPRALWVEGEASSLFKRSKREGATMAETVCQIWDQTDLEHYVRTGGDSRVPADAYRVSMVGLSTLTVTRMLVTSIEAASGMGNRYLWWYLPDTGAGRDLPDGGSVPDFLTDEYRRILDLDSCGALDKEVRLTDEAMELWREVYGDVKREKGSGMVGEMLNRGESYILRLALNYHLTGHGSLTNKGTNKVVSLNALKAALAVWDYCRASTQHIFGKTTGDSFLDELLMKLRHDAGWAKISDIRMAGPISTVIERGVQSGVLTKGVLKGRGRPPAVVGVTDMITRGELKFHTDKERDRVVWK